MIFRTGSSNLHLSKYTWSRSTIQSESVMFFMFCVNLRVLSTFWRRTVQFKKHFNIYIFDKTINE